MGQKAKRRIARLTQELAHAKQAHRNYWRSIRETQNRVDLCRERLEGFERELAAKDKKIVALRMGDPNEQAIPVNINDFLSAICTLPAGRCPNNEIYDIAVPSMRHADISPEEPSYRERKAAMPCRSVSYRVPVGNSTKRLDGWMLPSRIVLLDDGRRRYRMVDQRELDYLQRRAAGSPR